MADGKAPQTLPEIPVDMIRDAATKYERVVVRISRRNSKGHLQMIKRSELIPTLDLLEMDQTVESIAGGGQFRIEARDPNDATVQAVPAFYLSIEGPPRPVARTDYGPGYPVEYSTAGQPTAPPAGWQPPPMQPPGVAPAQPLTGWAAHLPPYLQHQYSAGAYVPPAPAQAAAPGASMPSDEMALRQIGDLKAEVKGLKVERDNLIEKLDAERKTYDIEIKKLRDAMDKVERDSRDERHRLEMKHLSDKMELMRSTPKDNGGGFEKYTPLILGYLGMTKDRDVAQQSAQSQLMTTMLAKKNDDGGMAAMMPMFLAMIENKSPQAQAAMMDQLMNSQMSQMGMQAQIIQMMLESKGEDQSVWAPLLSQLGGSAMEMFGAYVEDRRKAATQQAAQGTTPQVVRRGLPPFSMPQGAPGAPAQQQQFPTPGASYVTAQGETTQTTQKSAPPAPSPRQPAAPTSASPAPAKSNGTNGHASPAAGAPAMAPEQIVNLIMAAPQVPAGFKTPEWREILVRVHRRDDVDEVTAVLVEHLGALADAEQLFEDISRVFDDPAGVVTNILGNLPIVQYDPDYTTRLRDNVVKEILAVVEAMQQNDGEADTDDPEPEPEAPPAVIDSLALAPGRRR